MPRFAANLDWLFKEVDFLSRFQAAAAAGFKGVEFLFPYAYPPAEIAELAKQHHLEVVMFNAPAGNWEAHERGIASLPGREDEFRSGIDMAIARALTWHCNRIHVMAGLRVEDLPYSHQRNVFLQNLRHAARLAQPHGITLLVEAINPHDMPGYLVRTQSEAHDVCIESGMPNVRMQLDLYHLQRTEGDLAEHLTKYRSSYAHVQVAGVPGRHEPIPSEIDYLYLFKLLDELGYDGWVGCEYRPRGLTQEGLDCIPGTTPRAR